MNVKKLVLAKYIFTLNLIFLFITSFAQYYQTGVEPFKIKWGKKEFENIRVIFPAQADSLANIYLFSLLNADSLHDIDYQVGKRKIDVILHPNTVLSNGFVVWAPRRMEVVTQPDPNNDALLWHQTLSIHEMRHVKQMYSLQKGTTRIATWLFGEQAIGLTAALIHPWIFEGDAVWAETYFSFGGRGRSASFFQHYMAHSLENQKNFSYDKWLLGSYKDYIPNHYQFGYQLTQYINSHYGPNIIPNVFRFSGRYPFLLFPSYFAFKRQTGLSQKAIFQKTFSENDSIWKSSSENLAHKPNSFNYRDGYRNILYPYPINDSLTLAYITSLAQTPFFATILPNGKIKKIISTGYLIGRPSYNDSLIIWSEYQPHLRWNWKSSTNLKIININTNKIQQLANGRYFSPIFDGLNNRVIAIEYNQSGRYFLRAVALDGATTQLFTFENGYEIQEICFNPDFSSIYGIAKTQEGKKVFRIDSNYHFEIVLDGKYCDIRSLSCPDNQTLIFNFTNGFSENIYKFDLHISKLFKINDLPINSAYGYLKDNYLTFSHYTSSGYQLQHKRKDFLGFTTIDSIELYNKIVKAHAENTFMQHKAITFKTKNFTGPGTLLNIHSWFPYYMKPIQDASNIETANPVFPGLTLLSQNLTGSTQLSVGYGYGKSHLFFSSLSYYGFWPIINFTYEQTDNPAVLYQITQTYPINRDYRKKMNFNIFVPFTLSSGLYIKSFQIYNKFTRTNDYLYREDIDAYRKGMYSNELGIILYTLRTMAHRDLQPRIGFIFNTGWVTTPWDYNNLPNLWYGKSVLYLPGPFSNHGIRFTLFAQSQNIKYIYLNNMIRFPRGYSDYIPSINFKGIFFDYTMPLSYPDYNLSSLLYIKRLSLNLFSDFAQNQYKTSSYYSIITLSDNLQSFGFMLFIDFNIFRTWYPFKLYFTQAFKGKDFTTFSKFTLTINLNSNFARK